MARGKGGRKGKAKKKVDEEVVEETTASQPEPEPETEAVDPESEVVEQEMQAEEEVEKQEAEETPTEPEAAEMNGQQKRKAEDEEEEEEQETSAKRAKTEEEDSDKPVTLFCGNLDLDLSTETLKEFFETNGIDVLKARKIDHKRFGYVDVKPDQVDAGLALNDKELNGEPIRVAKSKPKSSEESGRRQGGDDKTLFVKNLGENATEETVKEFFTSEEYPVTEVRLPKKRDGLCKGFGYVVFDTNEALEAVLKEKQGAEFEGEKLFLDYTNEKSEFFSKDPWSKEFGPSKVLFVRNLSFQVSEDELMETFEGCVAVRIPPNEYGQPKGFGFVEFKTTEDAEAAQKDKDGLEINGRVVQLAFAHDKSTGGGGYVRGHGSPRGWGRGGPRGGGGGWGRGGGGGWGRGGWGGGPRGGWGRPPMRGRGGRPYGRSGYPRW